MKNIFITGISGLLGTNLYFYNKNYLKKKYKIYGLLNQRSLINVECEQIPQKKLDNFLKKQKIDYIFHCAANTDLNFCEEKYKECLKINFGLTKKIVDICKERKIKLIYISTDQLFDGKKLIKYTEKDKTFPLNNYSKSKLLSENYINTNLNQFFILRTSFFGNGPKYRPSYSDWIINNLKKQKKIIVSDEIKFNPIHLHYLSKIIFKLVDCSKYGTYNISSNKVITKYKFSKILCELYDLDSNLLIKKSNNKSIVKRPINMSLDNKKIKKLLDMNFLDYKKTLIYYDKSKSYKNFIKEIKFLKYK